MSESDVVVRTQLPVARVVADFVKSSVGAKVIMAVTGFCLWAFIIVHLIGNLQIFQGPDAINHYGVFLRELAHGAALWVARIGLIACFVFHIFFAIRLARLNRAARPVAYRMKKRRVTSGASMTMIVSGLLILAFLFFHLAHATWGFVLPEYFTTTNTVKFANSEPAHDVYSMMVKGFSHAWLVVIYLVGQIVLLSHLYHGTASLWQSLGWHHPTWSPFASLLGRSIAALIFIGNIAMPIVLFFRGGAM